MRPNTRPRRRLAKIRPALVGRIARAILGAVIVVPALVAGLSVSILAGCDHEARLPGTKRTRLVVVLEDPPRNLDPRFATDATSMRVSRLIFQGLVSVDNPTLQPRPELAASWTVDPDDARVWTVELRPNMTWHDGAPVTADDVVYTYRSVMDQTVGSPFRDPYQAHFDRVEAVSPSTVRFTLKAPYATFLTDLVLGIVPKHILAANADRFPEGRYIGTGPYRFEARYGQRRLDLVANETRANETSANEPGADGSVAIVPKVRHVVFRTIKDEGTRLLALLGGSVDLSQNGISPVLTRELENDPRLHVTWAPSIAFSYVALNLRHKKLQDRRVRQALALAIPREQIINVHLGGHATLATGMLAPMHWAYQPDVTRWPYDPKRARALLREAGAEGMAITIKISTQRLRRIIARQIAQAWRDVGIDANVRSYEFGIFFSDIKKGDFQAYLLDLPEPMEPDMYRWMLYSLGTPQKAPSPGSSPYARADRRFISPGALDAYVREDPTCRTWPWSAVKDATRNWIVRAYGVDPPYSAANRMFYANPLVDCRLDRGQQALDAGLRRPLYQRVQQILALDLPVIPLWHADSRVITRSRIRGFKALPNLRLANLPAAEIQ